MHPIVFTNNPSAEVARIIEQYKPTKVAVIADSNTVTHCLPLIVDALPADTVLAVFSAGEQSKILPVCNELWGKLTDARLDRQSLVINLGGGVVGDMGGFVAATYKRGIRFIQMPTTLLAQVDASVGGKLGVDYKDYKNHIGVFAEPEEVIIYTGFIDTLSQRQVLSGFAEIIKHALIADKTIWEYLLNTPLNQVNFKELVAGSVEIKKRIVEQDPFEKGPRKLLNFGHTVGHAIESYLLKEEKRMLLHGEAIAFGIIAESYIAVMLGLLSTSAFERIKNYIYSVYRNTSITLYQWEFDLILNLCNQDKKNIDDKLMFTLINDECEGVYNIEVAPETVLLALKTQFFI